MLTPKDGQTLPTKPFSHKKVAFVCSCGNETLAMWKAYNSGHVKSCGKCKRSRFAVAELKKQKFGQLVVSPNQEDVKTTSNTKILWLCDCGKEKEIVIGSVVNGYTKSCHFAMPKAQFRSKDKRTLVEWEKEILPIRLASGQRLPLELFKNSSHLTRFICNCGKEFIDKFGRVVSKHRKTCSKCKFITKESVVGKKYGKLLLLEEGVPSEFSRDTSQQFNFQCDCGNIKKIWWCSVIRGQYKTCGSCNLRSPEWWMSQKFGLLRVTNLDCPIKTGSEEKLDVTCDCGRTTRVMASDLVNGTTETCGCRSRGWSSASESVAHAIRLRGIKIESGYDELEISGRKYDIFAPSSNLVIEYHGLWWHSRDGIKDKDLIKYELAIKNGYKYIAIYEDEWVYNGLRTEAFIMSHLVNVDDQIEVWTTNLADANAVHSVCNLDGSSESSSFNVVLRSGKETIGAVSFLGKHIHRMSFLRSIDECVKAVAQWCLSNRPDTEIITDNRWGFDKALSKSGFEIHDIQDRRCYWVDKNRRRYNFPALGCYAKMWDVGHKHWKLGEKQ